MISLFQPGEAVTMAGFNQRLQGILSAMPSQNLKIATGSYVGTGTSGSSNPNTLSFNFAPLLLSIQADDTSRIAYLHILQGCTYACPILSGTSSSNAWPGKSQVTFSNNGKTISWYGNSNSASDNVYGQLNISGITYRYLAIGI